MRHPPRMYLIETSNLLTKALAVRDVSVHNASGVRVLFVDAKGTSAAAFYQSYGFRTTASEALTVYLLV